MLKKRQLIGKLRAGSGPFTIYAGEVLIPLQGGRLPDGSVGITHYLIAPAEGWSGRWNRLKARFYRDGLYQVEHSIINIFGVPYRITAVEEMDGEFMFDVTLATERNA